MIISAPPVRTDLKTTNANLSSKINDLSSFFLPDSADTRTQIQCIRLWSDFKELVSLNLEKIGPLSHCIKAVSFDEIVLNYALPHLRRRNISAEIRPVVSVPGLDDTKLVRYDFSCKEDKATIIGLHEPEGVHWELLPSFYHLSDAFSYTSGVHDSILVKALCHLASVLILNNASLGYVTTVEHTRFVQIENRTGLSCVIKVSELFPIQSVDAAFIAIAFSEVFNKQENYPLPLQVFPKAVATPNVNPLSIYDEGSTGHIKWWAARNVSRNKVQVNLQLEQNSHNDCAMIPGSVIINDKFAKPASVMLSSAGSDDLRHSASMLQYLIDRGMTSSPKVIVYGRLLYFNALVLEALGSSVTPSDLEDPAVVSHMHNILKEIHEQGIMVNSLKIRNFFIRRHENNQGSIQYVGFEKAKLYRRIPKIARAREHGALDSLIMQMMSPSK